MPWSPPHQYSSHRREERLAAQIARSKELRQEGFSRGREEFLASAITTAVGGGGGGGHERERERERGRDRDRDQQRDHRSMGMFSRLPVSWL